MLDSWTVNDAHPDWDFLVAVNEDPHSGRPESHSDVYNDAVMMQEIGPEGARWSRDAVRAWEQGEWCFATVTVTAIRKSDDQEFSSASVGGCDYSTLPGDKIGTYIHTMARDYVWNSWALDLSREAVSLSEVILAKAKETEEHRRSVIQDLIMAHTGATLANAKAVVVEMVTKGLIPGTEGK